MVVSVLLHTLQRWTHDWKMKLHNVMLLGLKEDECVCERSDAWWSPLLAWRWGQERATGEGSTEA